MAGEKVEANADLAGEAGITHAPSSHELAARVAEIEGSVDGLIEQVAELTAIVRRLRDQALR